MLHSLPTWVQALVTGAQIVSLSTLLLTLAVVFVSRGPGRGPKGMI